MLKESEQIHYGIYETNWINPMVKVHYHDIVTMSETSKDR